MTATLPSTNRLPGIAATEHAATLRPAVTPNNVTAEELHPESAPARRFAPVSRVRRH